MERTLSIVLAKNDPLDCAKLSLRSLEFTLTVEAGNELDLGGQNVSFTIVFSVKPNEKFSYTKL